MLDDDFDHPDVTFWKQYLETCRRLGVTPVTRERGGDLIRDWAAMIDAACDTPTVH